MKENDTSQHTEIPEPASLDEKRAERCASIEELIEKSSLGTPAAKALRRRTPKEVAEQILSRARELEGTPDATVTPITSKKPKKRK